MLYWELVHLPFSSRELSFLSRVEDIRGLNNGLRRNLFLNNKISYFKTSIYDQKSKTAMISFEESNVQKENSPEEVPGLYNALF